MKEKKYHNDNRFDILIAREEIENDDTSMWYYYRGLPEIQWKFSWWNSKTIYLYIRYKGKNKEAHLESDYVAEFYTDDDDIKGYVDNALYNALERVDSNGYSLTAADCITMKDLSPSSRQFYSELFNCSNLYKEKG